MCRSPGNTVIDNGVIQLSLDYDSGVSKLGLLLNVLRLSVELLGIPQTTLMGRLFFASHSTVQAIYPQDFQAEIVRIAKDKYDIALYVHFM